VFDGKLELPPRTAEHRDVLEIAREAFHAAAGLPNEWLRGIAFLAVHCRISEMMNADDASAIRIPVQGFLQAGQSKRSKWETWLPTTWDWRPLRGGRHIVIKYRTHFYQIMIKVNSTHQAGVLGPAGSAAPDVAPEPGLPPAALVVERLRVVLFSRLFRRHPRRSSLLPPACLSSVLPPRL
jgi:hypothetical protein